MPSSNNSDIILFHNFKTNRINIEKFNTAFQRRLNYEPISKIFNIKQFWSLDFYVNQFVLDPRPETELLIDIAIEKLDPEKKLKVLDLGTGSGIIAITLSEKCPKWEISATDCSSEALSIAKLNANREIDFYRGSWFEPLPHKKFDLIISNPPYISQKDPHLEDLSFEPMEALVSGNDGLKDIKLIIRKNI